MKLHVKLLATLLVVSYGWRAAAQQPQVPPVPKMWVSRANSIKRTDQFNNQVFGSAGGSKAAILTGIINVGGEVQPPNYTYPINTYNALIGKILADDNGAQGKGLRLFIGAYDPQTPAQAIDPAGAIDMTGVQDKQLIIIFAPAVDSLKKDVGTYYFIGPNDGIVYKIDSGIKKAYTDHYITLVDNSNGLLKTISLSDSKNQMLNSGGQVIYSDTRAIYYDTAAFVAFLQTEVGYQTTKHRHPDQIAMNFAAYTSAGGPVGGQVDRLIVLFEFVKNRNIIYIDDTDGFCGRMPKTQCKVTGPDRKLKALQQARGGDNGQLCPPSCP